jgi:hypothetical protein
VKDQLISRERRWRFTGWRGPEKICGEWWLDGFDREYFHIDTASGETLWVFTAPLDGTDTKALWLHGIFD